MKVAIINFPGTNCERDTKYAFDLLGANSQIIWHKETSINADLVVLPGGFSHGDYLRTAAIAKFSPIMNAVLDHAKKGGYILGICNGFQMLLELKLLSGAMNKNLIEASYSLGKGRLETLFRVALPSIKPSLLTALVISFAHTMGEFGVVLMIGGSVSNETKVASIAIYEAVELLDYNLAHIYAGIMLIISFCVLFAVYFLNSKKAKWTSL